MKKNLKLQDLKVKSFLTVLDKDNKANLKGGAVFALETNGDASLCCSDEEKGR